jgi:cysteinyl-tRNA synthetase
LWSTLQSILRNDSIASNIPSQQMDNHPVTFDESFKWQTMKKLTVIRDSLEVSLGDDLNTPQAMKYFFDLFHFLESFYSSYSYYQQNPERATEQENLYSVFQFGSQTITEINEIFGFFYEIPSSHYLKQQQKEKESHLEMMKAKVRELAEKRMEMKKCKLFQESDRIRKEIQDLGFDIKDGPNGSYEIISKDG